MRKRITVLERIVQAAMRKHVLSPSYTLLFLKGEAKGKFTKRKGTHFKFRCLKKAFQKVKLTIKIFYGGIISLLIQQSFVSFFRSQSDEIANEGHRAVTLVTW